MPASIVNRYGRIKRFATTHLLPWSSELLEPNGMDTNDEVRRRRLERLCEMAGGAKSVASAAATHWQYLDQVLKRRLLAPKKDGTRVAASLGDDVARRIESAYGLTAGWLDWPLDAVPYHAWVRLSAEGRGVVQGRMLAAMEQQLGEIEPERITPRPKFEYVQANDSSAHATDTQKVADATAAHQLEKRKTRIAPAVKRALIEDEGVKKNAGRKVGGVPKPRAGRGN